MKEQEILIRRIANKTWSLTVVAIALWAGAPAYAAPASASNYITFDPPNSVSTTPSCINASGAVTGFYEESDNSFHGFLRTPNGTIVTLDDPNGDSGTLATAINAAGVITGYAEDTKTGYLHGFVRSAGGTWSDFDPPNSYRTIPTAINNGGVISGSFKDLSGVYHGFVRAADGTITTFDEPSAGTSEGQGTATPADFAGSLTLGCNSLNNAGAITGAYIDSNNVQHGFVRSASGAFTTFDIPGATAVDPTSISAGGVVAGAYDGELQSSESFVRSATGVVTSFNPSNHNESSIASLVSGITPNGTLVGGALLSDGATTEAFVQSAQGSVTFIQVDGSSQTFGSAINLAGTITGFYLDASNQQHGFIAPSPY